MNATESSSLREIGEGLVVAAVVDRYIGPVESLGRLIHAS